MQANNEDRNFLHPRTLVITGLVLAAAAIRLAPHPMNFAPIGALALFGGAYFPSKRQAQIVPLLSLIIGDAITGFHPLIPFVYASFLVSAAIGFWLRRKRSATRIGVATLVGAMQFFLVTNFAMWASSLSSYPKTASGLAACYIAGIPLFWNTLAGDAFYVALLFGVMALAERKFPALRESLAVNKAKLDFSEQA
jgi:hypothetical protein